MNISQFLYYLSFWLVFLFDKIYSTIEGSLPEFDEVSTNFLNPSNAFGSILSKLLGVLSAGNLPT